MSTPSPFAAPAGRASDLQLAEQSTRVIETTFLATMMDAIPSLAMILNEQRQIVAVNRRLLELFGIADAGSLIGKRPGEALGCIHFGAGPDGCGTAPHCSVCGGVLAILASQTTKDQASGECRVTLEKKGSTFALELEATATPLRLASQDFTVFVLRDISDDKRRTMIEQVFFHDLLNTAGGIRGLASLLAEEGDISSDIEAEYKGLMVSLSDNLIDEISHQRRLIAAERGQYQPALEEVEIGALLGEVCELYRHHGRAQGRSIELLPVPPCRVRTDPPVVRRIIGNMLLNALEAIPAGQTVQVELGLTGGAMRIAVSNPGEIAPQIQLQIFQRSFSSKGELGRGLGTYSMKLFGERYLGGRVGFASSQGRTCFFLELPGTAGC